MCVKISNENCSHNLLMGLLWLRRAALAATSCIAMAGNAGGEASEVRVADARQDAIAAFEAHRYEEALSILEPMAKEGDAVAQYALALAYENGYSKKVSLADAVIWYKKAADGGHLRAMVRLGEMYAVGYGVEAQSDEFAVRYMAKAANYGFPDALHFLGMFATWGVFGVSRDTEKALSVFRLAADQGYEPSISMVGALEVPQEQRASLYAAMEKARAEKNATNIREFPDQEDCVAELKRWSFQAASMYFALIVKVESDTHFFAALLGGTPEFSPLGESYWECSQGTLRTWF